MPFQQTGAIKYLSFSNLALNGFVHAVFTRQGGISLPPWQTLNVGSTVGDDPLHVAENRLRSFVALGREISTIYDVWQVHGTDVVCTSQPRKLDQAHLKADAILTNQAGVTLFMRFADCVPILLIDPVNRAVGLVHAGWKGTADHIASKAVEAMEVNFASRPQDLIVGIGPSICNRHYPVGKEVAEMVGRSFPDKESEVLIKIDDAIHLDLREANRMLLKKSGVENIEISGECTACNSDYWYSHRAEHGHTGRFGAMIALA